MGKSKAVTQKVDVDALVHLIETLRGEEGCPWDKKQTPRSMSVYLVEEIYELIEAIESGVSRDICEELGDVLFLLFFLADIYSSRGDFAIQDILRVIIEKMTRRHPHVFGEVSIDTTDEVKEQWHQIKQNEKKKQIDLSLLDSVPRTLPAIMRAYRMSVRASKAGFDWADMSGVMEKFDEEMTELKNEISENNMDRIEMEYGDVLFTMINVARFLNVHPETALKGSIQRFEDRFKNMEQVISKSGRAFESVSQDEMDLIWETFKSKTG